MSSLSQVGPDLPAVARRAIESFTMRGERLEISRPDAPSAGVFVTLRRSDGQLRGCVGSLRAVEPDVVSETARSALLAATRDPRFVPVATSELLDLTIEVSVLMPEQAIVDASELDPARYGVIVRDATGRQGLLLPDVPGIDAGPLQIELARRKAGIPSTASLLLFRFEVRKYLEGGR